MTKNQAEKELIDELIKLFEGFKPKTLEELLFYWDMFIKRILNSAVAMVAVKAGFTIKGNRTEEQMTEARKIVEDMIH